jgi:exosortase
MGRQWKVAGAVAISLLLLALFYPTLRWLAGEWLGNDYYSHGPLVPLISAFFAWRLWRTWKPGARHLQPANAGLALAGGGVLLYLFALMQRAYFVAALAMIVILSGLVWGLLGTAALKRMAFPLLFLIFMVPLPFVEPLSVPMAQVTGVISAGIVRLFGVPVEVSGAQVSLPNAELVVGAQCSGLRSIVTLLTLVGLIVFVLEGALWRKVVLALSSIVIAAFGNVLRVASLLGVANLWGADAAFKYYHDYSGIVFFASAFVLLLLFSRLMGCREIKEELF